MVNVQINQSPSNIFSSFFLHIILGFNQFVHLLSVMLSNRREVCWNDKNYFIDIVDRMRHGGWGRFFCCLDRKEKTIQKCNLCMYNFSLFVKVIRKQKILSTKLFPLDIIIAIIFFRTTFRMVMLFYFISVAEHDTANE